MKRTRRTQQIALAGALALGAVTLGTAVGAGPDTDHASPKTTAQVGAEAPDFTLTDTTGAPHTLSDTLTDHEFVVLEWFNPDCPFVKGHHKTGSTMRDLYAEFQDQGVAWLAINSGAPGKQGAGLERNRRAIAEYGIRYPVLLDESGAVGHMYRAKTTPHMFIINHEGVLIYAGAIDGKRADHPERKYVRRALEQALAGETVTTPETRSYGCSVKYAN